jgi:unsaturated rhamnogalacturonyl hydrolase
MFKRTFPALFLLIQFSIPAKSQDLPAKITDSNTALHAIQPDYPMHYGPVEVQEITAVLDRLYNYLDRATPARIIDSRTKKSMSYPGQFSPDAVIETGVFRLISYEWGVLYGAMLSAADATGDNKFREYTLTRMSLISDLADYFRKNGNSAASENIPVRSVLNPRALDDAGSMCAAMIKTYQINNDEDLMPCIENYIDYISTMQFRIEEGTLARNRPLPNTLWLDDLYMSVPALAWMGNLTGNTVYFDDACRQIIQFSKRMFNREKGVYMHGWVKEMDPHPEFYWARCNGWAMLAMTELLDVLPENYIGYSLIKNQLQSHIQGISSFQSGTGLWHQLLDRYDSYLETSASAIFTYCIAHAINKGWIDAQAYGPVALLGWNAVKKRINDQGQVEGTCVGTGMAFDPAFYYHRPVNIAAAHGYGPAILAAAEMLKLIKNYQIVINDSAVMFYEPGTEWKTYR